MDFLDRLTERAKAIGQRLDARTRFPLLDTVQVVWSRLQQDRLAVTASSLTFTTVLALVPLFTVALSVFTVFPEFEKLRTALQDWLVQSLIPAGIAQNLMAYLTQFASKASSLGAMGFAMLFVTTLSLLLTIDRTLNDLWRVHVQRPLGQRLLVYWAALTLGPLLMGASLAITSYVVSRSSGLLPGLSGGMGFALGVLQWLLLAAGMTLLYRFVPNTAVQWRHAMAGGLFASTCMLLVRWGMGLYLARIPTYSVIYGAFATVPLLLMWMYISWLILLFGAVIAAYLPLVSKGVSRMGDRPGWDFQMASEVLQTLHIARQQGMQGLSARHLAHALDVDVLQLTPALEALQALGWIGQLLPSDGQSEPRHILLADPASTRLAPLIRRLLLSPGLNLTHMWRHPQGWAQASLQDLLDMAGAADAPARPVSRAAARPPQHERSRQQQASRQSFVGVMLAVAALWRLARASSRGRD